MVLSTVKTHGCWLSRTKLSTGTLNAAQRQQRQGSDVLGSPTCSGRVNWHSRRTDQTELCRISPSRSPWAVDNRRTLIRPSISTLISPLRYTNIASALDFGDLHFDVCVECRIHRATFLVDACSKYSAPFVFFARVRKESELITGPWATVLGLSFLEYGNGGSPSQSFV